MSQGLKIGAMAGIIAPYPTLGEVNKRAAGAYFTAALFGRPDPPRGGAAAAPALTEPWECQTGRPRKRKPTQMSVTEAKTEDAVGEPGQEGQGQGQGGLKRCLPLALLTGLAAAAWSLGLNDYLTFEALRETSRRC